jgi:hypothetical protein
MPANPGFNPFKNTEGIRVDLRLRNGRVARDIDPRGWRWTPWPEHPDWDFDIVEWQEARRQ